MIIKEFTSFSQTVPQILSEVKLAEKIKNVKRILIKPNLTIDKPPPCTTPVELTEEVIKFCQANSQAEISIAEGSGGCPTKEAFFNLGYCQLEKKYKISLIDLNQEERIELKNPSALVLKSVKLPKIAFDSFIINLPVLKEHHEAIITCAIKNLIGFYLNQKDQHPWSKSELHSLGLHQAIFDLAHYLKINFTLVDASIGQKGSEIYGSPCQPPIKKLIAGYNIQKIDFLACQLLGHIPTKIKYLNLLTKTNNKPQIAHFSDSS